MEALIPIALFICMAAVAISRGAVGKAVADRIARRHDSQADADRLRGELDEMRQRMLELEERVDFAERLLARGRDADRAVRS